jgi:hypothetical protein
MPTALEQRLLFYTREKIINKIDEIHKRNCKKNRCYVQFSINLPYAFFLSHEEK